MGCLFKYRYRYTDDMGNPVLSCPECGTRWDVNHGITLVAAINEMPQDHDTYLDRDGYLVDVDRLAENGYHAGTLCGDCGEQLVDMADVVEHCEEH